MAKKEVLQLQLTGCTNIVTGPVVMPSEVVWDTNRSMNFDFIHRYNRSFNRIVNRKRIWQIFPYSYFARETNIFARVKARFARFSAASHDPSRYAKCHIPDNLRRVRLVVVREGKAFECKAAVCLGCDSIVLVEEQCRDTPG